MIVAFVASVGRYKELQRRGGGVGWGLLVVDGQRGVAIARATLSRSRSPSIQRRAVPRLQSPDNWLIARFRHPQSPVTPTGSEPPATLSGAYKQPPNSRMACADALRTKLAPGAPLQAAADRTDRYDTVTGV